MFKPRISGLRCSVKVFACAAVVLAAGCSNPTKRAYEESTYGRPLEVPPDLTLPSFNEGLEIATSGKPAAVPARIETAPLSVLPEQANMLVMRDGAQRWLVLNGEPAQVWPWVRAFWMKRGFALRYEDAATGLMETEWADQKVSLPPDASKIKSDEDKTFVVPTREKYRVRFEHGEKPGTTELYVTHRGVSLTDQDGMMAWHLRASDPELEAESMKQLMVFLGAEQEKAGGKLAAPIEIERRATLGTDSQGLSNVHIDEDFARVWRRVELALDRLDYSIEDRDRSRGEFFVIAQDTLEDLNEGKKKSWWSRLFSRSSDDKAHEFRVVLKDEGAATNIYVRDRAGEKIDNTLAEPVLKKLQARLQ